MPSMRYEIKGQFDSIETLLGVAGHMATKKIETSNCRQIQSDGLRNGAALKASGMTGTAWVQHGAELMAAGVPHAAEIAARPAYGGIAASLTAYDAEESEIISITYRPTDSDEETAAAIAKAIRAI